MTNKKLNYFVGLIITVITLIIILTSENLKDLPGLLTNTNMVYIALAIVMMAGDWIVDGLILNLITKTVHGNISYFRSLKIAIIGQYYSAITPFSTGGVYLMSKDGISVPRGSLILFNKFVIY